MPWSHFEIWLENDGAPEELDNITNLFDSLFEFADLGCKDLDLHDPHVSFVSNADTPDWA